MQAPALDLENRLSERVRSVPPSGIRRFFEIAATMEEVISLGIGEPDFVSPEPVIRAAKQSLDLFVGEVVHGRWRQLAHGSLSRSGPTPRPEASPVCGAQRRQERSLLLLERGCAQPAFVIRRRSPSCLDGTSCLDGHHGLTARAWPAAPAGSSSRARALS
jgi:hypothetical protein